MITITTVLFIFTTGIQAMSQFPPFSSQNSLHRPETEDSHSTLLRKSPSHCSLDEVAAIMGLRELQELVETFSARKGVSPFFVLSKLLTRMRSRQELDETFLNTLEGASLQELLQPLIDVPPPLTKFQPLPSGAPYALLPELQSKTSLEEEPPLFIIPASSSSQNLPHRIHPMGKPDKMRLDSPIVMTNRPLGGKMNHVSPALIPLLSPNRTLRPPPGAVIHVNTGNLVSTLPDVTVTVSPLMTLIDAMRQAEVKYQSALGLNPDSDFITFARASSINCFVISQIDDLRRSDDFAWKVTVTDREGQELYDGICIPDEKEIPVRPGSVISLSYVRL